MGIMGRGKEELISELAELKGENRALNSQVAFLQEQLRKTQDALVAKESPMAYQDQKDAEAAAQPLSEEARAYQDKMRKQAELDRKLLQEMEQPLFKNAEDMQTMLLGVLNRPSESRSLHNDGES